MFSFLKAIAHLLNRSCEMDKAVITSVEIVEIINITRQAYEVDISHDDFMTRVPVLLGSESAKTFESSYLKDSFLNQMTCYCLPKREACLVAMSYSYEAQFAVYERVTLIENAMRDAKKINLHSAQQLREQLLSYVEKVVELEKDLETLTLQAKGLDRIANSTNVLGIRESSKLLKIGQKRLVELLLDQQILFRDLNGKLQAYQKSIDQGLVKVVATEPVETESGDKVFAQIKLTQKLIARLTVILEMPYAA